MQIKQRQKIIGAVTLLAVLSFVLPTHFAHAVVAEAANTVFGLLLTWIFNIIGGLTAIAAKALNFAAFVRPGENIPIVQATWTILRDFSNMIFIVLLVYLAFATIFDYGKYKFQDMIVKFILVAVFINFSLVIGNLIVDACQVLSNIFLGSIGNIGDRMGTFLNPSLLLPSGATSAGGDFLTLIFAIIISLIYLFSLAVALVFALIRIPIIWALLIVSPFAWMSHIIPGADGWWKKWWDNFWGWNLFLPVYLFFMYLGFLFLAQKDTIMTAVLKGQATGVANPGNTPLLSSLTNSVTFNLFFFYLFAAFVMVGGTWAAKEVTSMMGGGFEKGLGWARNTVGRLTGYDAAKKASVQKYGEVMSSAGSKLPWIMNSDKQNATFNRLLRNESAGKGFAKEADKSLQKFEDQYDTGKLTVDQLRTKVQSTSATTAEGYAYRKLAIKKGALNDAQLIDALSGTRNNPFAARDLIGTAKGAKFAGIKDLKAIAFDPRLQGANFTAAKRDILLHMAGDTKLASKFSSIEDVGKAVSILGGGNSPEGKKFLDDLAKVRPDLVHQYRGQNNLFEQPAPDATGKKSTMQTLYGTLKKAINTEPKNIAAMPDDLWKSPAFKQVLGEKLNDPTVSQKNRNSLRNNLEKILDERGDEDKIAILNEISPRVDTPEIGPTQGGPAADTPTEFGNTNGGNGTEWENDEEEEEQAPEENPPAEDEPIIGTASYKIIKNVNNANVIDLRNKRDIEIK